MFPTTHYRTLNAHHNILRTKCEEAGIVPPHLSVPADRYKTFPEPTDDDILAAMAAAANKGKDPSADSRVQTLFTRRSIHDDPLLSKWADQATADANAEIVEAERERLRAETHDLFARAVAVLDETADVLRHQPSLTEFTGNGAEIVTIATAAGRAQAAERQIRAAVELWWVVEIGPSSGPFDDQGRTRAFAWLRPTAEQLDTEEVTESFGTWSESPWRAHKAGMRLDLCNDLADWTARCYEISAEGAARREAKRRAGHREVRTTRILRLP